MHIKQITSIIDKNMSTLKGKYGVESIGVFGSVSRGEEKKGSDVDILVEFSKSLGFFKFIFEPEYPISRLWG